MILEVVTQLYLKIKSLDASPIYSLIPRIRSWTTRGRSYIERCSKYEEDISWSGCVAFSHRQHQGRCSIEPISCLR